LIHCGETESSMCRKTVLLKNRSNVKSGGSATTTELELLSGAGPTIEKSGPPVNLRRVRCGDPSAWDEILRRYGKLVSATVRSFGLQEADALDAVQTTWLRLAANADQIQHPERLAGWLATTARRECFRILREAKRAPRLTDMVADTIAEPSMDPERRVTELDVARRLWGFVNELSPRHRSLLRALFTDHPGSYAHAAHATGIPLGAIGPTRRRALTQLRGRLEEPRSTSRIHRRLGAQSGQPNAEAGAKRPRSVHARSGVLAASVLLSRTCVGGVP
jgi:RNA polymerase sigma factor (sigma-70 family)